jgi:signal peptidase II
MHNKVIFLAVAGFGLLTDQITKLYIVRIMTLHESIPVIDNAFSITYLRNPGAAFGLLAESGFRIPFLSGVSLVAMVAIIVAAYNLPSNHRTDDTALSLIFAGAGGNLIDRIRLGEVIDFLDIYWRNHHWPAFNIADSCICLGVLLYTLRTLKQERQRSPIDSA